MHEGDAAAVGSGARLLVHQLVSSVTAELQRGVEIRYLEADVVDARPPFGQEFGYGTVVGLGLEQFDIDVAKG